nr:PAS domain-containing protein [Desulfobulbaceae bacterium]
NVGCSTGEEAYSIAMQIQDYLDNNKMRLDVKIFATDIDQDAIAYAGAGTYPASIAADVDVRYLSKYFDKTSEGYKVKKNIRQMVIFAVHNIISDPPFTKIDMLVCRNLLIYLQPVLQRRIFQSFHFILRENGVLFLGNSETISAVEEAFEHIDVKQRIYKHKINGEIPAPVIPRPSATDYAYSAARVAYENKPHSESTRRNGAVEKYYQRLINKLVGTLLVVNENRELVQSFGDSKKFINLPSGNVSLDILAMLPREISLGVASAIQRVRKEKTQVVYNNIRIDEKSIEARVNVIVDMISGANNSPLFMVSLEEAAETENQENVVFSDAQEYLTNERINDLEREVQFTRENLQATIEELQTTNEELQATNEELLAANEELQSTNEELQSVNEELNTVNAEYQNKVLELTELNTDMDNLMTSMDIPTIFLDKNLCIRKFSHAMTAEINLLSQDIGRPLTDLNLPMFGNTTRDAHRVIKSCQPLEKSIRHKNGWFVQRILPFINNKKKVDGVVLALVRITAQKNAELALEVQHNLLLSVLESSPSATILVDKECRINFANLYSEEIFGIERSRLQRMRINSKRFKFTDLDGQTIPPKENPFSLVIESQKPMEKFVFCLHRDDGSQFVLKLGANPMFNKKKEFDGAVFRLDKVAYQSRP